jgi:hypothetical protein
MPRIALPSLPMVVLEHGPVSGSVAHKAGPAAPPEAEAMFKEPPVFEISWQLEPVPEPYSEPPEQDEPADPDPGAMADRRSGDGDRPSATVASLDAIAFTEHATTASVIVAGRVESVEPDSLVLRVELALKGKVAELVRIAVPADAEALLSLQPGSRLLAYLAGPEDAETDDAEPSAAALPLTLRPAGRGALVGLSPMTAP